MRLQFLIVLLFILAGVSQIQRSLQGYDAGQQQRARPNDSASEQLSSGAPEQQLLTQLAKAQDLQMNAQEGHLIQQHGQHPPNEMQSADRGNIPLPQPSRGRVKREAVAIYRPPKRISMPIVLRRPTGKSRTTTRLAKHAKSRQSSSRAVVQSLEARAGILLRPASATHPGAVLRPAQARADIVLRQAAAHPSTVVRPAELHANPVLQIVEAHADALQSAGVSEDKRKWDISVKSEYYDKALQSSAGQAARTVQQVLSPLLSPSPTPPTPGPPRGLPTPPDAPPLPSATPAPPASMAQMRMADRQMRHLWPEEIAAVQQNHMFQEFQAIPVDQINAQAVYIYEHLYHTRGFNQEVVEFFWKALHVVKYENTLMVGGDGRAYGVFDIPNWLESVPGPVVGGRPRIKLIPHFRLRFDRDLLGHPEMLAQFGAGAHHVYRFNTVAHEMSHGISAAHEFLKALKWAVNHRMEKDAAWNYAWEETRRWLRSGVPRTDTDHSLRFENSLVRAFQNAGFDLPTATRMGKANLPPGSPRGTPGQYGPFGPMQ